MKQVLASVYPTENPLPSIDDLLRSARELVPVLVEQQAETERARTHSAVINVAFRNAGFYKMLVPKAHGGLELSIADYHRVIFEIARGCPSTGWQLCLGTWHSILIAGLYDDDVQAELFEDGDLVCAAVTAPQGKARQMPDGNWRVSGVFNYASGIPFSTWFISNAMMVEGDGPPKGMMTFVVPAGQYTILNDWGDALGLKGSGSHSVKMDDVVIPARHVIAGTDILNLANGGAPRASGGGNVARNARFLSLGAMTIAALQIGMLKGAIDEFQRIARARKTIMPPVVYRKDHEDYRRWTGLAEGRFAMVEAAMLELSRQWQTFAERGAAGGAPFSADEEQRITIASGEASRAAWDVMQEIIWTGAGTSAAQDGTVMQRVFRDMATARTHLTHPVLDALRRGMGDRMYAQEQA